MAQITDTILMIRPVNFRMNEETAVNNYFQEELDLKNSEINAKAQEEFDAFVEKLRSVGVKVIVIGWQLKNDYNPAKSLIEYSMARLGAPWQ